ncbi:MAG: hypothetical protein GX552_05740 [Chloroflexi bacterium]|nr:hypothetical protein [Chloroflexota bacterium]
MAGIAAFFFLSLSLMIGLATSPARYASKSVNLRAYGLPGTELVLVYPTRLNSGDRSATAELVTVYARALEPSGVRPIELILPLPNEAVAFVDASGLHVPGRLEVLPGHPDALPYDLRVAHANTQLRGTLLRGYRVNIVPIIRLSDQTVSIPELGFYIRLESALERAIRSFANSFFGIAIPYLLLGALTAIVAHTWHSTRRRQRLDRERQLSKSYSQLRELIKLEQWADARQLVEDIRLIQPRYRDIDQLDTLISSAETAAWRREQLYRQGVQAYKQREWPAAINAFATIESETPYYRDVRFLRRTATLYADLHSRDRSRRLSAAKELGEIADLIDFTPLLRALGDHSDTVADAAEASFRAIGLAAFDSLLMGLADKHPQVAARSYRIIEEYGQSVRDQLLAALRSSNPQITQKVATLLVKLGVREELADALLWASEPHLDGITQALVSEGIASAEALVETLFRAPADRQQVVINALSALRMQTDIARHLEEAARSIREPEKRELLQRALQVEPTPFHTGSQPPAPQPAPDDIPAPPQITPGRPETNKRSLRSRLLDRRSS